MNSSIIETGKESRLVVPFLRKGNDKMFHKSKASRMGISKVGEIGLVIGKLSGGDELFIEYFIPYEEGNRIDDETKTAI